MSERKTKSRGRVASAICRLFGCIILIAVIAALLPVTVPRLMGYEVYDVISGSMEPEIPVGSVIYVKSCEPSTLEEGDIVAFYSGDEVVAHRVTENHKLDGDLVTKGDANEIEDFSDVPYRDVIGRVVRHYPVLGEIMVVLSGTLGKILIACFALCGVLLNVLAANLSDPRKK